MASGGIPTPKSREFQKSFSMCLEPFSEERSPKFLPCFHTFCLICLSVLEASVTMATPDNQQEAGEKDIAAEPDTGSESAGGANIRYDVIAGSVDTPKIQFLCPTCRVPVHLPVGGVADLQTNFYLSYDVAMCDICPEGSQQRADVFCQDCDKHICPSCRRHHDKYASCHHVTTLRLGQPGKARSEKKAFCSVHQDQTLCFHCRQCDTGICVMCKLTTHEGHPASDIGCAVVQAKSELPSLLTEATQQLQVVQTSIRHTERQDRHLSYLAQNLTRQINTRYDLLVAAITQSRDELLEELSDREEQARSPLLSERNSASVTVDTLSGLVSRASCASGNDVISVKKELQAALLSEDSLNHHRQQTVRQDSWPGWTYDVPEVSAVPATACMGRVVEAGADDVTKPRSMADQADKLDRLENDMTKTKADVAQNKADLTQTTVEVTKTKADVAQNKVDLTQTTVEVTKTKADVAQNKADLTQTTVEVTKIKADVAQNKADLTQTTVEVTKTKADVAQNKADLTQTTVEVTKTKADVAQNKADLTQTAVEITKTKADVAQNKADLTHTAKEVTKTKADVAQNKAEITKNTAQINTISTSVKLQAGKIDKAGTMVSFSARCIDKTKSNRYEPVVFSEVTVNEGGGYQRDTGVFTVPVAGTYIFSACVMKKDGQPGRVVARIMVDGTGHDSLVGSSTSSGSSSVSPRLDKGQTVWVKACSNVDDFSNFSNANYFTGALVQPQL